MDKADQQKLEKTNQQFSKALEAVVLPQELLIYLSPLDKNTISPTLWMRQRGIIPQLAQIRLAQQRQEWQTANSHDHSVPLSEVALQGWLKKRDITPTPIRIALMTLLFRQKKHHHITAEAIYSLLQRPSKNKKKIKKISLASVYNNLNLLVKKGFLIRHDFSQILWQDRAIIYDTNIVPHHHIIDRRLNKIYDLPLEKLPLDNLVEQVMKQTKQDRILPRSMFRDKIGRKKRFFTPPMVFILE